MKKITKSRNIFCFLKSIFCLLLFLYMFLPADAAKPKPPLYDLRPNAVYEVSVRRVVDGDTIVVDFPTGEQERVRLIGVDTPETVHPKKPVEHYGKEASAFTKKELTGKNVWLQMDVQVRDRYQRTLGYVWMEKPGESEKSVRKGMFNARLLLEGYGHDHSAEREVCGDVREVLAGGTGNKTKGYRNKGTELYLKKKGVIFHGISIP